MKNEMLQDIWNMCANLPIKTFDDEFMNALYAAYNFHSLRSTSTGVIVYLKLKNG